jgi:hypothetical protein
VLGSFPGGDNRQSPSRCVPSAAGSDYPSAAIFLLPASSVVLVPVGRVGRFSPRWSCHGTLFSFKVKGGWTMKAGIIFTGTGPILILTTYESFDHPKIVEKLKTKGINKYIASELPLEKVKAKYGNQYNVVMGDLKQTDDLRVLDYNGYNVFYNFKFSDMAKPVYCEQA